MECYTLSDFSNRNQEARNAKVSTRPIARLKECEASLKSAAAASAAINVDEAVRKTVKYRAPGQ